MITIGLCGAAGAGKGTVADALVRRCGLVEMAFADPIYEGLSKMLGISIPELKDRSMKEAQIPWLGRSPRHALQTLGTEWGRKQVASDIWITLATRRLDTLESFAAYGAVVTDVRFSNEAEAIRSRGGVVWEIRRPGAVCLDADSATHESERGLSPDLVDAIILNDSTLDRLAERAVAMFDRQFHAGFTSSRV